MHVARFGRSSYWLSGLALAILIAVSTSDAASAADVASSPVVLENEHVRITIDKATGAVLSLTNRKPNTECMLAPKTLLPPVILDTYSANQAIYIRDAMEQQRGGYSKYDPLDHPGPTGDLKHLREPVAGSMKVERADTPEAARVICTCEFPGGVHVTYTISLPKDSPTSTWQISVDNRGAPERKDDVRVYRTAFPVLDGLAIGGRHEDNKLARPYAQGELIPDPVNYNFRRPNDKRDVRTYVLTYIGWASMPWMDLFNPTSGVYLASYDPTFEQVDLESWPHKADGTMTLDMRTLSFLEPGKRWQSQTFAVGIHPGDWHWGADAYRAWARANHKPYSGPEWVRKECDGWFGTGGPVPYDTYPKMLEDAKWLGLDYLQIWSQMLENVGPNKTRKMYYPFLFPDPDRGGEAGIAKAVQDVRKAGGHIGFYHNVWTWDSEMDKGLEQWKSQLPADVKIPQWWGDFRKSASVFPDGSREAGNHFNGYSGMCQSSKAYQDYVVSWIVDRYVKRYGVDTWYFDSMPVTMFAASRVCFSDEHGPCQPHGVGRGCLELMRRVSEAARPTTHLAMTSETVSDALMQYNSHALGIELVGSEFQYPKPEIYTYTFTEHPIFSGSCNNQQGLINYYPDVTNGDRFVAMNRVFLMGYRFDVMAGGVDPKFPFHLYLRSLIALRKQIKADLYDSEFRDDVGLGKLPDRVEAKLFQRRNRSSFSVTLYDRRPERAPLALTIDLSKHQFRNPASATLYTFDGKQVPIIFAMNNEQLTLNLPQREAEVAAIVVRTK